MRKINLGQLLVFLLFICFCIGVILGRLRPHFFTFLIFSLISLVFSLFFYRCDKLFLSDIFILVFFLFLGALWQTPSSIQSIDKFLKKESRIILKVVSLPNNKGEKNTFLAETKKIDSRRLKRRVKVSDYTQNMDYLSLYQLSGRIVKRKYRSYSFYSLRVDKKANLYELPLGVLARAAKETTNYILNVFRDNCSDQGYRFLSAVFLGRRELLVGEKRTFSNAGVSHLLAISGLHLGLTSLILFFVLRFFNIKFRTSLLVSLGFLYFYTFLTGASPSTLRATIMYSVFAFSFLLQRKANTLNSLSLAGFIALLLDSSVLFTIGFQLSFIAVFSIILGFKTFKIKPIRITALHYLKQIFFCSLFVTIFLTPVVSYYFGKIYILSIFFNVILIPFFTFVLAINFLLLLLSPFKFIAQSLGGILSLLIHFFIKLVQALGSMKFSFISYSFSPQGIVIYYFLLGGILVFLAARRSKSQGNFEER